jgi:hypothetical protein
MTRETQDEQALKPCPFCGTQAVMRSRPADNQTGHQSRVLCGNPFCNPSDWYASAKDACKAWNTREAA